MAQYVKDQSLSLGITITSPIVFEAGQRRCGPPENWTKSPPGKGCEIFIAKIPKDCFEKELIPIFGEVGIIYTFRLMMENEINHRGFGFCIYDNHEIAKEAVLRLNNYQIKKNWYLGVCFSVDNCRLFVGGIPKMKTKMEIHKEMSAVTENVVDIIVYPSAADKNKNRGFAFVEYTNHKAAAIARKKMITNEIQLWGHVVAVDWAEPERKVEDEIMQKVKILYVRNLMLTTSENTIYQIFSNFTKDHNEIIKVKKIGDFAFVHFKNRDQAEIVRMQTHGMQLEGSTIEVHFAKPVNKLEQQQKLIKKSNATLSQALPLIFNNDRLSGGGRDNNLSSSEKNDRNGMIPNRSYRNAAGRCSIKSRQIVKNHESNEIISQDFTSLLTHVCQKNGWGTPFFTIQILPLLYSNNETPVHFFIAQACIPCLNYPIPSRSPALTHEEAISNASENALLYLFYNGIQVPYMLGNFNKNDSFNKGENFTRKVSDTDSMKRTPSNHDVNEFDSTTANSTQPNLYMSPLFQYNNVSYYGSNQVPLNRQGSNSEIGEYNRENTDQFYPLQKFQKT